MLTYPKYEISREERERLILEHLPQVRWIAASIHERLGSFVSEEDLVSTGIIGLISAIDNFDPSQNASLRTYAEYRIRGSILDSLRGLDGVPTHRRKRVRQIQEAITAAERRLKAAPAEEDIAHELGITISEYHDWLLETRGVTLGSLDAIDEAGSGPSLLAYIADENTESPIRQLERTQLEALLADAVAAMPKVERTVIHLYFMEELTLREIGEVVGLHVSRISQLKSQALLRLRAYIDKRWPTKGHPSAAAA